jgi:oligoribonuclease NrnB/cAMP/cGMP phosphodiesterase (DHH superfamily)
MKHRILTHGGCTSLDGFASAYIFKKYFTKILNISEDIEVKGINHEDYRSMKFNEGDIVLDLPKPNSDIFFWCDHHITAKPTQELKKNYYWEVKPSCAGYLIEIAYNHGIKPTKSLDEFKKAIDDMDSANYTLEQIKKLYYSPLDDKRLNALEKVHLVSSMLHTKDQNLNKNLANYFLSNELSETPISDKNIFKMQPLIFHKAQVTGYQKWREWVDDFTNYDQKSKTVITDHRKAGRQKGNADRFYAFVKYQNSSYSLRVQEFDDGTRISIGSNIFHKDRCKVDIGKMCQEIATEFGDGVGGGHYGVGGTTVKNEKTNQAINKILKIFKET